LVTLFSILSFWTLFYFELWTTAFLQKKNVCIHVMVILEKTLTPMSLIYSLALTNISWFILTLVMIYLVYHFAKFLTHFDNILK